MIRFLIDWLAKKREFDADDTYGNMAATMILVGFFFGILAGLFLFIPPQDTEPVPALLLVLPWIFMITSLISSLFIFASFTGPKDGMDSEHFGVGVGGILLILLTSFFAYFDFITHWLAIVVAIVVMAEVIFLLDKGKPNEHAKAHILQYTTIKKFVCFIEAAVVVPVILGAFGLATHIMPWFEANRETLITWFGYGGMITVALIVIYVYIMLNSLKYQKALQEQEKPKMKKKRKRRKKK